MTPLQECTAALKQARTRLATSHRAYGTAHYEELRLAITHLIELQEELRNEMKDLYIITQADDGTWTLEDLRGNVLASNLRTETEAWHAMADHFNTRTPEDEDR